MLCGCLFAFSVTASTKVRPLLTEIEGTMKAISELSLSMNPNGRERCDVDLLLDSIELVPDGSSALSRIFSSSNIHPVPMMDPCIRVAAREAIFHFRPMFRAVASRIRFAPPIPDPCAVAHYNFTFSDGATQTVFEYAADSVGPREIDIGGTVRFDRLILSTISNSSATCLCEFEVGET
jgi:hypothetical protein